MPRGRPKKETGEEMTTVEVNCREDLDKLPLETWEDYNRYNTEVKKLRKKLGKKAQKDSPIHFKFCPNDLFQQVKVRVVRNGGQAGMPIYSRRKDTKNWMDFELKCDDGEEVVMPQPMVSYLHELRTPKHKQIRYPDGSIETVVDHYKSRFSCQVA